MKYYCNQECEVLADLGDSHIRIEDVKRLVINPGEVLLVKLPNDVSDEFFSNAQRALNEIFKGVKVLLFKDNIEFTVVEDKSKDMK